MKKRLKASAADATPDLHLSHADHEALKRLVGDRSEGVAELLREELDRAAVHDDRDLPSGVVGLNHWVHFTDGRSADPRRVQIVMPAEADIDQGRISVLSHIGAGLIGLTQGHSILWTDPSGVERVLTPILVEDRDPFD